MSEWGRRFVSRVGVPHERWLIRSALGPIESPADEPPTESPGNVPEEDGDEPPCQAMRRRRISKRCKAEGAIDGTGPAFVLGLYG